MARALKDAQLTPADELRRLLTECEELLPRVQGDGDVALRLLEGLDRIAALWPVLEDSGVDLRAEAGRWEGLHAKATKRGAQIVRAVARLGGLQHLRRERYGSEVAGDWWYLAERLATQRRGRFLKTLLGVAGAVVVVFAVSQLVNVFFPVDPAVKAASMSLMSGQIKLDSGSDYAGAIQDFRAATEALPSGADGWIWLGSALQATGADGWVDCFERARGLSDSDLTFHLSRSQAYLRMGLYGDAQDDLRAALALDPGSPEAYYFLASVYESQGDYRQAIEALQNASEAAGARDMSELVAMARLRLGVLMQSGVSASQDFDAPIATP